MKYAIVSKLGGELLEACNANYEDYKGFLKCPNCKEPVFLRKSHSRDNKTIESSFIHHKAIPEVSTCELRIGRYTRQDIEAIAKKAQGQRIQKLNISLWKYLKTNIALDLSQWSQDRKEVEEQEILSELVKYSQLVLENNIEFVIDDTLTNVQKLLFDNDPSLGVTSEVKIVYGSFLKKRKPYWDLHCKISREALELCISSNYFKEIRYRLICSMCHPGVLKFIPQLLDTNLNQEEIEIKISAYISLQICLIFLTVDWINVFNIH